MQKFMRWCKELVAPNFCAYCKIYSDNPGVLCQTCADLVAPVVSASLSVNKQYTVKVFAVSAYKEPLKHLILSKMWSDRIASRNLGELMWEKTYVKYSTIDCFVPIPLHWTRYAQRGFNQTSEIAAVLSKKSGKPVAHLLKRIKKTKFQSAIPAHERTQNLKEAFALTQANLALYQGKHIMLVDDLLTTGSTLQSAAKELIKLKPASISAVVGCRVI